MFLVQPFYWTSETLMFPSESWFSRSVEEKLRQSYCLLRWFTATWPSNNPLRTMKYQLSLIELSNHPVLVVLILLEKVWWKSALFEIKLTASQGKISYTFLQADVCSFIFLPAILCWEWNQSCGRVPSCQASAGVCWCPLSLCQLNTSSPVSADFADCDLFKGAASHLYTSKW